MQDTPWVDRLSASWLAEHLQDGVYAIENELLVYANPALCRLLGRKAAEIVGHPFIDLIAPQDRDLVLVRHRDRIAGMDGPERYTIHLLTADNHALPCELHVGTTVITEDRYLAVGNVHDVTEKMAMQEKLLETTEELARIYQQLPDMYYRADMDGILIMASPACVNLLGYTQQELVERPLAELYRHPRHLQRDVRIILRGRGKPAQTEAEMIHKNGHSVWIQANSSFHEAANGAPAWVDGMARDITTRKRMEEQLAALARTDGLTGVYSRRHFIEASDDLIRLMKRNRRPLSLMMADLDHFKQINDAHGHHAGDQALVAFATTCREIIRKSDLLGRVGGEEFAIILPETALAQALELAERLREATAAVAVPVYGGDIRLTVSIGVTELADDETSLHAMMRRADVALYQAKAEGRNQVAFG